MRIAPALSEKLQLEISRLCEKMAASPFQNEGNDFSILIQVVKLL